MSTDGLTIKSLKDDPFVDLQGAQDDACVPAAQKPYTVKHNIPSEGALRFGGIHHLHHAGRHQKVGTDDLKPRIRRQGRDAPGRSMLKGRLHLVE